MLPPVLEIHVIWHPGDSHGLRISEEFVHHFHGTIFSGLIGGAIEVYIHSKGWNSEDDSPRPIPFNRTTLPPNIRCAQFIAVVPILGNEMASAVEQPKSRWREYIETLVTTQKIDPCRISIFPYLLDRSAVDQTYLGGLISKYQRIAANPLQDGETEATVRCRDLTQGIAQFLSNSEDKRLTVFISHTKRISSGNNQNIDTLIQTVRDVVRKTRLKEFFDASDLQPGQDWDAELRSKAATSALLSMRTELYPSREWCQREILIAKREGMPVIIMDVLDVIEERGSFLMDHVPRVPMRLVNNQWSKSDIHKGLNLLVNESLKRTLWRHQSELARNELGSEIAWWAPHAPEPITLIKWLNDELLSGKIQNEGKDLLILHPDPPLGYDEKLILQEIFRHKFNKQ